MRDVREEGGGGGEEGAASVRGVHHLAAVLQQCVPEGELEGAQGGVQGKPCEEEGGLGGRGAGGGDGLAWRGLRGGRGMEEEDVVNTPNRNMHARLQHYFTTCHRAWDLSPSL